MTSPEWYDEDKLIRLYYDEGYTGWAIDLGDGTCRLTNKPLLGEDGPQWGDRVPFVPGDPLGRIDKTRIIERYQDG